MQQIFCRFILHQQNDKYRWHNYPIAPPPPPPPYRFGESIMNRIKSPRKRQHYSIIIYTPAQMCTTKTLDHSTAIHLIAWNWGVNFPRSISKGEGWINYILFPAYRRIPTHRKMNLRDSGKKLILKKHLTDHSHDTLMTIHLRSDVANKKRRKSYLSIKVERRNIFIIFLFVRV